MSSIDFGEENTKQFLIRLFKAILPEIKNSSLAPLNFIDFYNYLVSRNEIKLLTEFMERLNTLIDFDYDLDSSKIEKVIESKVFSEIMRQTIGHQLLNYYYTKEETLLYYEQDINTRIRMGSSLSSVNYEMLEIVLRNEKNYVFGESNEPD